MGRIESESVNYTVLAVSSQYLEGMYTDFFFIKGNKAIHEHRVITRIVQLLFAVELPCHDTLHASLN